MEMLVRAKRDVKPLTVKFGIALALSFAGFLLSRLRSRHRLKLPPLSPRIPSTGGSGESEAGSKPQTPTCGCLKEELRLLRTEDGLATIINGTTTTTTLAGLSPTSRNSGDDEGLLLPEFNELVMNEFETVGKDAEVTPKKNDSNIESVMEQEIAELRDMVLSLRERERSLELQLLEYYGLQEREAAFRELENQVKLNSVEAKLYTLKIEALQADKERLQDQLSNHSKVVSELETARAKIKFLKKKMRSDSEQTKEKIIALQKKISILQERQHTEARDDQEIEWKSNKLKELEDEAFRLRSLNSELMLENSELTLKLDSAEMLVSSIGNDPEQEVEAIQEVNNLRHQNDKLKEEIDQLKTSHCADVEELVYLRWVNACLRYEMRNYQPPPGKTMAKDLSKNLSPKSEAQAKQLILEYANSGGDVKSIGPLDFESEYSSSSQTSAGECDDPSFDIPSLPKHCRTGKSKFFVKLKKLALGKHSHGHKISSHDRHAASGNFSERGVSFSSSSDDVIERDSYESFSSCMTEDHASGSQLMGMDGHADRYNKRLTSSGSFSQLIYDGQTPQRLYLEDRKNEGLQSNSLSPCAYKRKIAQEESLDNLSSKCAAEEEEEEDEASDKIKLRNFASALKCSHGIASFKGRSSFSN